MIGLGVGVNRRRFAGGFAGSYSSRVIADGGTIEALTCVAAASSLLQSASLLLIPSGYKEDVAYSELPTNGNGDLTWTRASDAWRTNSDGLIQRVPWNLLQRSEEFDNAAWSKTNATITANSTTAPNGTLTADSLIEDSTNNLHIASQGVSLAGGIYSASVYVKPNGRNWVFINIAAAGSYGAYFDVARGVVGTIQANITSATMTSVGNGWYRCVITANTSATSPRIAIYTATANGTNSYTGDGTSGLFIWGAQLVEGSSAQTYFPTTDRLNVPRLSYMYGSCPALLLEPQRTNSIRNSTMQGAVAGSPGTLPTYYSLSNGGLTPSIVGVGVENGLNYIDVRLQGTATGTNAQMIFDTNTSNNATANQTYIFSFYSKLISGSANSYNLIWDEWSSTPTYLGSKATSVSLTSTTTRFSLSGTTSASCSTIQPFLRFLLTIGNVYDFTFRVFQPQLELGAYFTTPIFTSGTFATRLADTFTRNNIFTNGLISASGGTWYVELRNNIAYMRDASGESLGIGDTISIGTNALTLRNGSSVGSVRLSVFKYISGVSTSLFTTTTDTVKIAIKWNGTSADVFANGTKVVSATSFTPTNMEFFRGFGQQVPNFIQAMALYPTPLSDAQCQTLTT